MSNQTTPKICDEYFKYLEKYKKEYGDNTCVFMQIGSFYEIYNIKERISNLNEVAGLLNIQVTKKNKNIDTVDSSNPYMAGFPKVAISKFLSILLDNGYTVVVIDQEQTKSVLGKIKRFVSGIYSPSIRPSDMIGDENNLASVFVEMYSSGISYSFLNFNMSTNTFDVYERNIEIEGNEKIKTIVQSMFDDLYRIIIRYNIKELIVNIIKEPDVEENRLDKEYMCEYFNLFDSVIHWNVIEKEDKVSEKYKLYTQYKKIDFQNEYLKKVYKHVNFGLLDPIEFFDLEMYQTSIINIIYLLNFISRHDEKYIEAIAQPKITNEVSHLILEMNTLQQLNIIPDKSSHKFGSLFNVINKTQTAIGKRGLKSLLCKPFKDVSVIKKRYNLSKNIEEYINKNKKNHLEKYLSEICDFERLHRTRILQFAFNI